MATEPFNFSIPLIGPSILQAALLYSWPNISCILILKKRWLQDSFPIQHNIHFISVVMLHWTNLSCVRNLFLHNNHKINECFGIYYLNHTRWCQRTLVAKWFNTSFADLIENKPDLLGSHFTTSGIPMLNDYLEGRNCAKSSTLAILLLSVGIFHSLFSMIEETLACSVLPNYRTILGPYAVNNGPLWCQLSYQNKYFLHFCSLRQ